MGVLRLWWGTPTPPELVGERLLPLMSANQFVALLLQFQPHPKTGPLGLALLGQCVIGILLGPAYALAVRAVEKTTEAATRWKCDRQRAGRQVVSSRLRLEWLPRHLRSAWKWWPSPSSGLCCPRGSLVILLTLPACSPWLHLG